jgi:hypothetical protein
MQFFYTRYYSSIAMASITGLITGALALQISNDGWQSAASWAEIVFFIVAAATIYYSAFPKVYKHTDNIAKNRDAYLDYINLENEVRSFACTGEDKTGQARSAREFLHYLDVSLEARNKLHLGFDTSQIPDFKAQLAQQRSALAPAGTENALPAAAPGTRPTGQETGTGPGAARSGTEASLGKTPPATPAAESGKAPNRAGEAESSTTAESGRGVSTPVGEKGALEKAPTAA